MTIFYDGQQLRHRRSQLYLDWMRWCGRHGNHHRFWIV